MFRQIIVGMDGSEKSLKAARVGCDLAKRYAGTVTLVHVPHAETAAFVIGAMASYYAEIIRPTFKEIEEAGEKILADGKRIAEEIGCTEIRTHMPHGDAATEILSLAAEIEADLIVTGRRGLSTVSGLVLGSTTQRINHLAACACLSVR